MDGLFLAIQEARERAIETLKNNPDVIGADGNVNVEMLAKKEGVDLTEESFEDGQISGFIQMKTGNGRPAIVVNSANSDERRRFTIAHELGHYFLHKNQSVHIDDVDTADLTLDHREMVLYRDATASQATHICEIQANQYAAELLMPRVSITQDAAALREQNYGMSEIVEKLSGKYKVSQSAMAIRLNKLS